MFPDLSDADAARLVRHEKLLALWSDEPAEELLADVVILAQLAAFKARQRAEQLEAALRDAQHGVSSFPSASFRVRYAVRGGHTHCRMFQSRGVDQTWEKNGDLVFDEESWAAIRVIFTLAGFDVLPEDR